jgi:putative transposase
MPAPTRGYRHSIRLKDYDYSTPGAYFVTICINGRKPLLRQLRFRKTVEEAWAWLPERFGNIDLDEFVVMPDHIHFVICLLHRDARRGGHLAAQGGRTPAPTLPNIVGAFKTVAAKAINRARGCVGEPVWQRNYFEHIVRTDSELERIREYIRNNPHMLHSHDADELTAAWEILRS